MADQAPSGHGIDAFKINLAPPRGGASLLEDVCPENSYADTAVLRVSLLPQADLLALAHQTGFCFQG